MERVRHRNISDTNDSSKTIWEWGHTNLTSVTREGRIFYREGYFAPKMAETEIFFQFRDDDNNFYQQYKGLSLPKEHPKPIPELISFISKLMHVEANYEKYNISLVHYCGGSKCRLCPEFPSYGSITGKEGHGVGGSEYHIHNEIFSLVWPEGYMHYLVDHNVVCSESFYKFIMSLPILGDKKSSWEENEQKKYNAHIELRHLSENPQDFDDSDL